MMRNTMSFVKLATFRVNCFWLEWKHIFLEIWPVFTPKVLFLHTQVCSELNPCYFLMKFFLDGWDGSPQIPSKLTTRWMREVISSRMHVCHNSFTFWQRAPLPLPCSDVGSKWSNTMTPERAFRISVPGLLFSGKSTRTGENAPACGNDAVCVCWLFIF